MYVCIVSETTPSYLDFHCKSELLVRKHVTYRKQRKAKSSQQTPDKNCNARDISIMAIVFFDWIMII